MLELTSEKKQFWSQRIAEWRASGLTTIEFFPQQGINRGMFYTWRKRLAPETVSLPTRSYPYDTMPPETPSRLELVELKPPHGSRLFGSGVTLSYNGIQVNLDSNFDDETLRHALSVMGGLQC